MAGVVRSIKNYAKGFSEVQIKVREATSNDSSGPSGSLMNEIAQLTFNEQDFIEIMDMLDRRLNDKGKNWRHVFKALLVLDYCLHVGSENVVLYAKENIYVVRTLKEFQHIDDTGKDVGFNVRQKAKDITSLLLDENRLKEERRTRKQMQDRMAGVGDYMNDVLWGSNRSNGAAESSGVYQHPGYMDEDKDLKRAIEESKRLAEQESRKRGEGTEDDLQRAIRESEQEARESERKKKEALERENQNNLFGNASSSSNTSQTFQGFPAQQNFTPTLNPYGQTQQQWPQATGMSFAEPIQSNPYQQQQPQENAFDTFSLQAQMTGMPPQQAQMTGLPQQAQMTGLPQQAQFTGAMSNPYGQQQSMFGTPSLVHSQTTMQMTNSNQLTPTTTQYPTLNSMLQQNNSNQTYTGFSNALVSQNNNQISSMTDSPSNSPAPFTQPFAQQPNRNPFGQPASGSNTPTQGQKSLLEMMQEQKLQQQQLAQPGFQQQPQMTGNQPMNMQQTGYQAFSQQPFGQTQQPQQPPFNQQSSFF